MTLLRCYACGSVEEEREEEGEIPCEDCGSHGAQRCSICGELIDQVMATVVE